MRALLVVTAFVLAGCARGPEAEVGRPGHPYAGKTLVMVPRACLSDHGVNVHPGERYEPRTAAETVPPAKTARLQALLDGIGPTPPLPLGPRPDGACEVPVDSDLADVRATKETISAMSARGASYALVLEVHTELACSESQPWSPRDACMEDQVTIAAWMFDTRGAAIWSLARKVGPTDEPTAAIDRVLERVPTTERLHRTRGEYEIGASAAL